MNKKLSAENSIEIYIGEEVFGLLNEAAFQRGWDELYEACPWATVFQSRTFVATWYRVYQKIYLPILVKSVEGTKLTGLLALTKDEAGCLVGAGMGQAEYQVWLAENGNGAHFIRQALRSIRERFPRTELQLKYIPGKAPLNWTEADVVLKKYCLLHAAKQPLMIVDEEQFSNELRKKNRREKINRLKRMGTLTFERVTDSKTFHSIFDDLALQYDFRKAAMFNRTFFQDDACRKAFLLALFEQQLLHVTILKLNGRIIASNVGVAGKNWVHLQGVNTHDPCFAKYSPGILHFLMLGKQLAEEGVAVFDLTPGADAYKDALANEYAVAYKLSMGSRYQYVTNQLNASFTRFLKQGSHKLGVDPGRIKKIKKELLFFKDKVNTLGKAGFLKRIKGVGKSGVQDGVRMYKTETGALRPAVDDSVLISKDSLSDLLAFENEGSNMTRWAFLQEAMRRFEAGQHCFSWREDGKLLGCVWLCAPKSVQSDADSGKGLKKEPTLVQDFYIHAAGRKKIRSFLPAVAAAVSKDQQQEAVCMVVRARDTQVCRSLEELGFNVFV